MGAPRFTDGRVVVRALRTSDVEPYIAALEEDDTLLDLIGWEDVPTRARIERWLDENWVDPPELHAWEFVVADAETDAFLGTIILHSCDWKNRRAEIGFWLASAARGRGVGSAALRLCLAWAFGDLDLDRIELTALPENEIVPRLARRFGFVYEGRLRKRNFERGRRVDLLIWGLLREDASSARMTDS